MTTFVFFTLHDVVDIRLNFNILAIAFWGAVLALARSTSARRPNHGFHWPDLRNVSLVEVAALCLLLVVIRYLLLRTHADRAERARRYRLHDALLAQAEVTIYGSRARAAEAAEEARLRRVSRALAGRN